MYDLAIIGAGPAGSTLARLIGKNFRVILIDRVLLQMLIMGVGFLRTRLPVDPMSINLKL